MKNINRVVLIFFVIILTMIVSVWNFFQTKYFAALLSDKVNSFFLNEMDSTLEFSKIEIKLFPPATNFHNVSFVNKSDKYFIKKFTANNLGVYFSIKDLMFNDFRIDKIQLENGSLNLFDKTLEKQLNFLLENQHNNSDTFDFSTVFNSIYSNVYDNEYIKLKRIVINNLVVKDDLNSIKISSLKGTVGKKRVDVKTQISNIYLPSMLNSFCNSKFCISKKDFLSKFDLIDFDISIDNKQLIIDDFRAIGPGKIDIKAQGPLVYENGKYLYELEGQLQLNLKYLENFHSSFKNAVGIINTNYSIKGIDEKVKISGALLANDLVTKYFKAAKTELNFYADNDDLKVQNLKIEYNKNQNNKTYNHSDSSNNLGNLRVLDSINLRLKDIMNNSIDLKNLKVKLDNVPFLDLFHCFHETLSPLHGQLDGIITLSYSGADQTFKVDIDSKNDNALNISDLAIQSSDRSFTSVELDNLQLTDASFQYRDRFDLNAIAYVGKKMGRVDVKGFLDSKQIDIALNSDNLDLGEIRKIVNQEIQGSGKIYISFTGEYENIVLNALLDQEKFKIFSINAEHIYSNFSYRFKEQLLSFKNISLIEAKSKIDINGDISFLHPKTKFNILTSDADSKDVLNIFREIYAPADFFLRNHKFVFSFDGKLEGAINPSTYNVSGSLSSNEAAFFSERLSDLSVKFSASSSLINLHGFSLKKENARIFGNFLMNLSNNFLDYDISISNLKLSSVNAYRVLGLGLDGPIEAKLEGEGSWPNLKSRTKIFLTRGRIGNREVPDSQLSIDSENGIWKAVGNFFNLANLKSEVDLNKDLLDKNKKNSQLSFEIVSKNIQQVLGLINEYNLANQDIKGILHIVFDAQFNIYDLINGSLKISIEQLRFKYKELFGEINPAHNAISIKNGRIDRWDILIFGKRFKYSSTGIGSFQKNLKIVSSLSTNASVIDLITANITNGKGVIDANFVLAKNDNDWKHYFDSTGKDLSFKFPFIDDVIENLDYHFIMEGKQLMLDKFSGKFLNGDLDITGKILFPFPFPDVDIKANIQNANYSLAPKSNISFDGNMSFNGTRPPYNLVSNVFIKHAKIKDEISDLVKSFKKFDNSETKYKFLPANKDGQGIDLFNYNLDFSLTNSLDIQNSLVELYLSGDGKVLGNKTNPHINCRAFLKDKNSKVFFKGHEFALTSGDLVVEHINDSHKFTANYSGDTKVNNYKITANFSLTNNNYSLQMQSDPPLSHQDILSLLTIGVTSDISKNLNENELQALTSLGVGSFLADQFNINQNLNSSFGLNLSLMPEFQDQSTSYLQGRTENQSTGPTSLKSTTKLKVSKKISKQADLSFSSTLGGAVDQKQEMNLNYNLNNNFSLQGIYEIKSAEESGEQNNNSAGFDLIFRKSFK